MTALEPLIASIALAVDTGIDALPTFSQCGIDRKFAYATNHLAFLTSYEDRQGGNQAWA